jgi:ABC-2 type transport system ATP-binding protein
MPAATISRQNGHDPGAVEPRAPAVVELVDVTRSFDRVEALRGVSFTVAAGEICALLGPNGAGKTTLVRILGGLQTASSGSVRVLGVDATDPSLPLRGAIGLVPSGDRTFYLRISGVENLVFFARLHGLRRRAATARAREVLAQVGLAEAGDRPVSTYSHGMQKRLGVARALLAAPRVLLVDEATHDLDPVAGQRVRELVRAAADAGAGVLWATQRLDEIRRFADQVVLLDEGAVRFRGTVPELLEHAVTGRFLLQLAPDERSADDLDRMLASALAGHARLDPAGAAESGHYVLSLTDDVTLGDAIAVLAAAGVSVLACRQEGSEVEQAFLSLVGASL